MKQCEAEPDMKGSDAAAELQPHHFSPEEKHDAQADFIQGVLLTSSQSTCSHEQGATEYLQKYKGQHITMTTAVITLFVHVAGELAATLTTEVKMMATS